MAKAPLLGHCACPECGFAEAEIRTTKTGKPYRYCPDCNSQYFARTEAQEAALLKKIAGSKPEPVPVKAQATSSKPDPVPAPKRGFSFADL